MTAAILSVAALAVAGILWSEARHPRLEWFCKPLASLCFILLALQAGALESAYGRWLLGGLILCMAGDVLLIPTRDSTFLAGLASFLAGHLLYGIAFLQLPRQPGAFFLGLVPVLLLAVLSLRWLRPHLPRPMRLPVLAYIAVICGMLLLANGTWGGAAGGLIVLGAWGFAISDLAVARNRFVAPGMANRYWGIPLYYAAQLILANTAGFLQT
jgi:uncharacterized membrane protein YhhN